MQAIVQDSFGTTDVLELRDIELPQIAEDEVLVQVHAAGVDRGVWHLMMGMPYLVRLAGFGLRAPKQPVPGLDLAGVVEAVGSKVTRFAPGDEVLGIGIGTYAEFARAPEAKLVPKPANMSFEQAGALAISGLTALQGLRDHGRVETGQRVLVVGASGGVGSFAVQIAKAMGAHVTGVASTTKLDFVRSLGADAVVDYSREDFTAGAIRHDVIIDIGGGSKLRRLRGALTEKGTLVVVGSETGGRWVGGVHRTLGAMLQSPFVSHNLRAFISSENGGDIAALVDLVEDGKLMPAIERTFALSEAPKAIQHLVDGHARGKVVVTL